MPESWRGALRRGAGAAGLAAGRLDRFQQRRVWLAVPVAVVRKAADDQGGGLAALIAYYGFLGVFPLLLLFASVLGLVLAGHPDLERSVIDSAARSFPGLSGFVNTTVSGGQLALGLGLAGAVWAGLGVTRATERAMDTIWDIPLDERPSPWWGRVRGALMLVVLGTTFLASDALAAIRGGGGVLGAAGDVVAVAGGLGLNLLLFGLAFMVLTNRRLAWRTVLPGAVAGAVGWTALLDLGAYFVRHEVAHASQLYGSLGVVIGLVAWIYLGARLIVYCAELNVVLEYRLWPRSLGGTGGTDADRRALLRQVREAQRSAGERIEVTWSRVSVSGSADGGPEAGGPAAAGVAAVVAELQLLDEFDRRRERAGTAGPDVAAGRRAAAARAVDALRAAAAGDPDLAAALGRDGTGGGGARNGGAGGGGTGGGQAGGGGVRPGTSAPDARR